jgi:hypothetical protein
MDNQIIFFMMIIERRSVMKSSITKYLFYICIIVSLGVFGCGGGGGGGTDGDGDGGGGGGGNGGGGTTDTVEESLNNLGVDTTSSPRLDNTGNALPDDYSPMGTNRAITRFAELYMVGVNDPDDSPAEIDLAEYRDNDPTVPNDPLTSLFTPTDNSWADSLIRAGTSGDIDGDGKEEVLIVYKDPANDIIYLRMTEDADEGFAEMEWQIALSNLEVHELDIVTGDFDGDMQADIVVGVSEKGAIIGDNSQASLLFLQGDKTNGYTVNDSLTKVIAGQVPNAFVVLTMKSGNIDYDASAEIALTINEYSSGFLGGTAGYDSSSTRYFVYDDASTGFVQLLGGPVQDTISGTTYTAVASSVALGDIDADSVDEIVLGGLQELVANCDGSQYLLIAIDDNAHGLMPISSTTDTGQTGGGCENNSNPRTVVYPWVNTLDIDGDKIDEIHINGSIYDDFRQSPWEKMAEIPRNDFSHASSNSGFAFRKNTTTLAVGDVMGDKLDDIVFRMPRLNEIAVWGYQRQNDNSLVFQQKYAQPVDAYFASVVSGGDEMRPLLILANVDDDSVVVEYTSEYQLVFSEPIIIAALAAPPCQVNAGQNTDECFTQYGTATSSTISAEAAVTLSASGHVGATGGFELPIIKTGVEVEFEQTVTASVTAAVQGAYTVTKSETFNQDPLEDTVVITTVPYDQYTYRVVSHPEADAIGKAFVLSVPRSPRTFQVERGFYNANVADASTRIADSVFTHLIGDPASYLTRSQKDSLLSRFGGFEDGPRDVDLTGSRTNSIDVATEVGASVTLAVGWERTLKVTALGVMNGYSVGAEASSTLGYTVGTSTAYTGTVGGMDPTSTQFSADNLYSWGLLAYTQDSHESGQSFQVINYWVE